MTYISYRRCKTTRKITLIFMIIKNIKKSTVIINLLFVYTLSVRVSIYMYISMYTNWHLVKTTVPISFEILSEYAY